MVHFALDGPTRSRAIQQGVQAGQESHAYLAAEAVAQDCAAGLLRGGDQQQRALSLGSAPGADVQRRRLPQQGPGQGGGYRVVLVADRAKAALEDHGTTITGLSPNRGLERQDVATLGTAALEHQTTVLGLHTAKETVGLGTATIVGLKGPLHDSTSGVPSRGGGRTFNDTSEVPWSQG